MRRILFTTFAAVALVFGGAAVASAQDTDVTVTVEQGALAISVPTSSDLGTGTPGTTATGQIGTVTVTDNRALLTATWTASVSSTAFTTGGATGAETIPNTSVRYWSGPATATSGTGVFTPAQPLAANAVTLSAEQTAFTLTAGVGSNTASWNPTLLIDLPAAAVGGLYTGTVTHTVL
ncbi:hypothetical protein [Glycomyces sp. YM15]|uniref:hypothetical protein n=1 Tax=Glycomyces sp. YM15 TaxID=2800446 RepID=UPI0019649056|nr:hypothetical protein [Glycomyces sp. YM15]